LKRFRGGLVFKAHRLVYHSTLALRVIKKKGGEEGMEQEPSDREVLTSNPKPQTWNPKPENGNPNPKPENENPKI